MENVNLERYIEAHKREYKQALEEIKSGKKKTHWIWYIFPQIDGLGMSSTSKYYAIKNIEEAQAYLNNEYLYNHLIEMFIERINTVADVFKNWTKFVKEQKEIDLKALVEEENLNEDETRKFLNNSFRDGQVKTTGTDIEKILPPLRRFGGSNRTERKQTIIQKVSKFFEKYFGIVNVEEEKEDLYEVCEDSEPYEVLMVAEDTEEYNVEGE